MAPLHLASIAVAFLVTSARTGVKAQNVSSGTVTSGQAAPTINVATIIRTRPDLGDFANFLNSVGVPPGLGLTVFCPQNKAFDAYGVQEPILWPKYQRPEWLLHLREICQWQLVTEGQYTLDAIFNGQRTLIANSIGNITIDQKAGTLDGVSKNAIVEPNISATDGIAHIMDQLIVPPFLEVDIIQRMLTFVGPKFAYSTMANLAVFVGLDAEINKIYDNGFTMLVPTNRRFNRASIDVPSLLTDKMKNYTRDFILCHLVMDNYYESSVFAMQQQQGIQEMLVTSLLGTNLWITTTNDMLRFQSVPVIDPDQLARNGYVRHVFESQLILRIFDLPDTHFCCCTAYFTASTFPCFLRFARTFSNLLGYRRIMILAVIIVSMRRRCGQVRKFPSSSIQR